MLDMQPDDGDGDGDGCDTAREMVSLKYGMQIVYVLAYVCMLSINVWTAPYVRCAIAFGWIGVGIFPVPVCGCLWMGLEQTRVAWSALKCECVWEC